MKYFHLEYQFAYKNEEGKKKKYCFSLDITKKKKLHLSHN